jgi:hypothetical protein
MLAAKIRYLVLNRTNEVIAPRDENLPDFDPAALKAAGEIPKKFSPSFTNKDTAKAFASALAAKYGGDRFYVAQVLGGAVVETSSWTDAVSGELYDEILVDDDTANE